MTMHDYRIQIKKLVDKAYWFFLYPNILSLKRNLDSTKEQIILVGTPIHKNLGDHLIAEVEVDILKKTFKNSKIIEIPTDIYLIYKKIIVQHVNQKARVFISGGGWMGDIWSVDEERMQDIIMSFSNHKVIVLPQTLFYENEGSDNSRRIIESARRVYSKCDNLTLMFRDRNSYSVANRLYGDVVKRIILFPDMGQFKQYKSNRCKKSGILMCLREDRERIRNDEFEKAIIKYARERKIEVDFTSTLTKHRVPAWLRKRIIKNKLHEFEKYKLVVTDRLHGMIYSYLSEVRCVAIDNKTHKVSGVYNQWMEPYEAICIISEKSTAAELITQIQKMMDDKDQFEKIDMSEKINELYNILKG